MFIIFWRGKGFLAPLFGILGFIILLVLTHFIPDNTQSKLITRICVFVSGAIAAGLCWRIGSKLNDPKQNRVVIDKQTGQEITLKRQHTFMFIPMQYYAFLWAAIFATGIFIQH